MITKIFKALRCAIFSDVHLGHPKTSARHIVKSLDKAFPNNAETALLDIIIIAGDLFDQGLHYTDDSVRVIQNWALRFLRLCAKNNITLRILEGTPLHDRGQTANLADFNTHAMLGADIKYVDTLSIERLEKFDLSILYIPDEWRPDPDQTWLETKQALGGKSIRECRPCCHARHV